MDSAIEITSDSSSSGSDDEVSEPTRTRSNTLWLYGTFTLCSFSIWQLQWSNLNPACSVLFCFELQVAEASLKGSSEVHTQASVSNAPSQPRDSTKLTVRENNVSGVDNEKLPAQQAQKRTIPPSFNPPHAPSRSANSISHANKADNTIPATRGSAPSYLLRDTTTFTRNVEYVVSSNVSGVDDKKLPAQQANTSKSANSVSHGNVGDYSSPAVGNKNTFGDGYYRGAHAESDCSNKKH